MINKIILTTIIIMLFFGCKSFNSKSSEKDSVSISNNTIVSDEIQNKILGILEKLPEFNRIQNTIDSISNQKKGVATIIEKSDLSEAPGYRVQAGFNGDDRFETFMTFYINSKTFEVKIFSTQSNEVLSLEEWRISN